MEINKDQIYNQWGSKFDANNNEKAKYEQANEKVIQMNEGVLVKHAQRDAKKMKKI